MVAYCALDYYFVEAEFIQLRKVVDDEFVYFVVNLLRECPLNHFNIVMQI